MCLLCLGCVGQLAGLKGGCGVYDEITLAGIERRWLVMRVWSGGVRGLGWAKCNVLRCASGSVEFRGHAISGRRCIVLVVYSTLEESRQCCRPVACSVCTSAVRDRLTLRVRRGQGPVGPTCSKSNKPGHRDTARKRSLWPMLLEGVLCRCRSDSQRSVPMCLIRITC